MQASFLPAQPFSQPQTSSIPFSYFALTMPNDIACLVVGLLKNSDKLRLLQTCRFWRKMVHLKVKSVQKKRLRNAILHLKTAFDMPMQPQKLEQYAERIALIQHWAFNIGKILQQVDQAPDLNNLNKRMSRIVQMIVDNIKGFGEGTYRNFLRSFKPAKEDHFYQKIVDLGDCYRKIDTALGQQQELKKTLREELIQKFLDLGFLEVAIDMAEKAFVDNDPSLSRALSERVLEELIARDNLKGRLHLFRYCRQHVTSKWP